MRKRKGTNAATEDPGARPADQSPPRSEGVAFKMDFPSPGNPARLWVDIEDLIRYFERFDDQTWSVAALAIYLRSLAKEAQDGIMQGKGF